MPSIRQRFHLSPCSDFRSHFCLSHGGGCQKGQHPPVRTGSMNKGRWRPTAAVLGEGRVLVTGGGNNGNLASAEIYAPSSGAWSSSGDMEKGRINHTMTVLTDGRVFVVGGGSKKAARSTL